MNKKEDIFYNLLKISRPYQWVKNTLVFLPMIMSHNLNLEKLTNSFIGFIVFSIIASSIYIINDIADKEADKKHPFKKKRPLAAGLIKIDHCLYLVFSLLIISGILLIYTNKYFIILIFIYFIISNTYTFFLKKLIIIDLITLSFLYTLRIIGGGLIADISISIWLISFSVFFFIALASVKRLIEILNSKQPKNKKIAGRGYLNKDKNILNTIAYISAYGSIFILILYINSPQVLGLYSSPIILWLMIFVMFFWISRIIVISNKYIIKDDPIIFAIKDLISYICLFLILCIMLIATFG